MQLLAAPNSDGMPSGAPRWSALVMGGVVIPYEEVVGIRVVESAHEFIVEHRSVAPDPFNLSSPTSQTNSNTTPLNLTSEPSPSPHSPHTSTL